MALVGLMLAAGFAAGQLRVAMAEAPRLQQPTAKFEAEACVRRVTPRSSYTEIIVGGWSAGTPLARWSACPVPLAQSTGGTGGRGIGWPSMRACFQSAARFTRTAMTPRRIAFFDRVGAEGWLGRTTTLAGQCREAGPLADARAWLRKRLLALAPDRAGGVLVGVTTGWRGDISREDAEAMRNSGLGHLLAISGLHVGLVVGLILVATPGRAGIGALLRHCAIRSTNGRRRQA